MTTGAAHPLSPESDPAAGDSSGQGPHQVNPVQLRPRGARPLATDGERRALASVLRLRILRMCLYEPLTNKEIADRLQRDPATVLHHVRTLVTHGFLQAGDPRSGPRGSREVPYRATGKSLQLDYGEAQGLSVESPRTGHGAGGAPGVRGITTAANTVLRAFFEEVSEVPENAVRTTRLGLRLSDEHLQEFTHRIGELLEEFVARPHDPNGQRWSLFLAMHPEPGDLS